MADTYALIVSGCDGAMLETCGSAAAWPLSHDAKRTAAMIDRLVHHADVINVNRDSYRLKNYGVGRVPAAATTNHN